MNKRYSWLVILVGFLVGAIVLVSGYILVYSLIPEEQPSNEFTGIEPIEPPQPVSNFTLTNQAGEAVALDDLRGKLTLITFGFTHCPDICPTTVNEFERIHAGLGDMAQNVNFVFISVDGERDTPEVLRRFLETQQSENVTALTGTEVDIRRIIGDYGARFYYHEADENGSYSVDHSAGSFLLNDEGRYIRRYTYGTERHLIIEDLRQLLGS